MGDGGPRIRQHSVDDESQVVVAHKAVRDILGIIRGDEVSLDVDVRHALSDFRSSFIEPRIRFATRSSAFQWNTRAWRERTDTKFAYFFAKTVAGVFLTFCTLERIPRRYSFECLPFFD